MTKPLVRDIIKEEADQNRITVDYLLSDTKTNKLVKIRHYTIWRARKETGMSFSQLGKIFNRDHSSVIHAYYKLEREYAEGGILQIRPPPPTEEVGRPRVVVPRIPWATTRSLLELIQVDGKWSARRTRSSD